MGAVQVGDVTHKSIVLVIKLLVWTYNNYCHQGGKTDFKYWHLTGNYFKALLRFLGMLQLTC